MDFQRVFVTRVGNPVLFKTGDSLEIYFKSLVLSDVLAKPTRPDGATIYCCLFLAFCVQFTKKLVISQRNFLFKVNN